MANEPLPLRRPEALDRLRAAVTAMGGQAAFAAAHDISPSYLSSVLKGRDDAGPKILTALGLRREDVYVEMGAAS